MSELIKAFQIFSKYTQDKYCISTDHYILYVHVEPENVSLEDIDQLETLGFDINEELGCFYTFT